MSYPPDTTKLAVIGLGCYYPGSENPRELWENILTKKRQFRQIPEKRLSLSDYYDSDAKVPDKTYAKRIAVIDGFEFDWAKYRIPKSTFHATDIVHWLALEVTHRALLDAGYTRETVPSVKTGIIVGNTLTGEISRARGLRIRWPYVQRAFRAAASSKVSPSLLTELEAQMEYYYKSTLAEMTEESLAGLLSNTIAGRICNFFNLKGGGYTVDGACSSSLIAVAKAAQSLVNGELDLAIAGGVDISLDPMELIGFAKTQALTSSDMKVYDRRASGFIPGEGCGFVVLKRLEEAQADGNYVYAILRGWGISSDGSGVGITAPSGTGQAIALQRAYQLAGYSPQELDFIEGHGTGTKVGDLAELKGIVLAMNDQTPSTNRRFCGVTSLKSIIGHTKAAAGIGGFIKAVIAVNRRVLPPTAGCQEPNDEFHQSAKEIYPILQGECRSPQEILRAGVSAMGFGGSNSHVTLESGDPPSPRLEPSLPEKALLVSSQETELFIFSAASWDLLTQQVQELGELAIHLSQAEMIDLAAALASQIDPTLPLRAAIIATTPDTLAESLNHLTHRILKHPPAPGEIISESQQAIWLGNQVKQCRVGFLFPGQGSQQINMARVLVERHPWAEQIVEQSEIWLGEHGFPPIWDVIARPLDRLLSNTESEVWKQSLAQTQIAQPAICLASLLWLHHLSDLGIRPVSVGGHSLGELTAFYAAGAFDAKTLLTLAAKRGQAMATKIAEAGTMASLACSYAQAERFLQLIDGSVTIANLNSPNQIVISGERSSVEQVVQLADQANIPTYLLPVSNAFHSPLVAVAAQELRKNALVPDQLSSLQIPLFSSINGQKVTEDLDLREHFAQQVTAPVNFVALVETLSSTCDLLLEVGPGRVLTGLVSQINGIDGKRCFPIEAKAGQEIGLNVFLATLFVRGGEIHWPTLYQNRLIRPFISPLQRRFIENPCEQPFPTSPITQITSPISILTELPSLLETNLLPLQLSDYFSQRGKFIEQVILADLQNLPTFSESKSQEQSLLPSLPQEQAQEISPDVVTAEAIAAILVQRIAQETGFPIESIFLNSRLLDDLNLESIKAGEIIATTAIEYGVAGKIDPIPLANSTLQEISEAIYQVIIEQPEANGSSQEQPEEIIARQDNWVRNFQIQYVPEASSLFEETFISSEYWANVHFLLLCEASEAELIQPLSQSLSQQGAIVEINSFSDHLVDRNNSSDISHVIAILPRTPLKEISLTDRLPIIVERLRSVAIFPLANEAIQKAIVYVQFGGGYGGTHLPIADVEQCCATAFAASLHIERPDLKIRVLDFPSSVEPTWFVEQISNELLSSESYAAIGFNTDGNRLVARPFVQNPANYKQHPFSLSKTDVILVTGGGKGITAECALSLAEATGVRMALVGSSPPPSVDALEKGKELATTLERFQTKGLSCFYYQCDVADLAAVKALIKQVEADMGLITGVIHGAALNKPSRVDKVSLADVLAEIRPKLYGIIHLCEVLSNHSLKLLVGFGSQAGISGLYRNAWYSFSNEAMALLLRRFSIEHLDTATLCIAYGLWQEKGMGVNLGAQQFMQKLGHGAITTEEGTRRFVELIQKNPGDQQIAVVARLNHYLADTWCPPKSSELRTPLRFLEQVIYCYPNVQIVTRVHLNLERDYYLKDHVYKGTYLFPTVFGLEAMAQAVAHVTGNFEFQCLRIENIDLHKAITVNPEQGMTIEVHAQVLEKTTLEGLCLVQTGIRTSLTGFTLDHFSATFVLGLKTAQPLEPIQYPTRPLDINPSEDLYGSLLFQGPLYQRLQQYYLLDSEHCIFSVNINAYTGEEPEKKWLLGDPYCRDSLLQAGQASTPQDLCLPVSIESIEIFRPNYYSGSLIGIAQILHRQEQEIISTTWIVDDQGYLVERLNGYRARILERCPNNPTVEELVNPDERDTDLLTKKLEAMSRVLGIKLPALSVSHISGLQQLPKRERHQQESPLIHKTIQKLLKCNNHSMQSVEIEWSESGQPLVQQKSL